MEDKNIQKGTAEIKKIQMTASEKERLLQNILHSPLPARKPVQSPWTVFSFASFLHQHRLVSYSVALALVLILGGGGAVFASGNSLPGNLLYPVKVSIVEPIHSALLPSPESKAEYQSALATKRLVETETLAAKNELDPQKEQQISSLLESHTVALNQALDEISQTKPDTQGVEKATDIATNFQAEMNAHAQVLDLIKTNTPPDEKGTGVGTKTEDTGNISRTARSNAERIGNTIRNKRDSNSTSDSYAKKKEAVRSIIDSTTSNLNQTEKNTSPDKKAIIENTNKTLDQAKELLNKADQQDKNGDQSGAYSTLLNSESSAKQADIFFKTGSKLNSERTHQNTQEK